MSCLLSLHIGPASGFCSLCWASAGSLSLKTKKGVPSCLPPMIVLPCMHNTMCWLPCIPWLRGPHLSLGCLNHSIHFTWSQDTSQVNIATLLPKLYCSFSIIVKLSFSTSSPFSFFLIFLGLGFLIFNMGMIRVALRRVFMGTRRSFYSTLCKSVFDCCGV